MPFLNFGGNKNKYCHLSDINLNVDPDLTIQTAGDEKERQKTRERDRNN